MITEEIGPDGHEEDDEGPSVLALAKVSVIYRLTGRFREHMDDIEIHKVREIARLLKEYNDQFDAHMSALELGAPGALDEEEFRAVRDQRSWAVAQELYDLVGVACREATDEAITEDWRDTSTMTLEEAQKEILCKYLEPMLERQLAKGLPWGDVVRGCIDEIDAKPSPSEADLLIRKHLMKEYGKMRPRGDA